MSDKKVFIVMVAAAEETKPFISNSSELQLQNDNQMDDLEIEQRSFTLWASVSSSIRWR